MNLFNKFLTLLFIPCILLIGAYGIVQFLIKTKPESKRSTPLIVIPNVEILTLKTGSHTPDIDTYGIVKSYYETEISSLIAGEITSISPRFQSGDSVKKGEVLVTVNKADYLANLAQQKAAVSNAKQNLLTEQARGRISKNDWLSSGRKLKDASPYSLRIPQQEAATYALKSAEASLAKAQLDIRRTEVTAPYDAIIKERNISPGGIVKVGAILGKIISREKSEVRLPLKPKEFKQIKLPLAFHQIAEDSKSTLSITLTSPSYTGNSWKAEITRAEASVDTQNQMIYVIAEIKKPFDGQKSPLPIGTFVKANLKGKPIPNTISLPESSIIDDQYVWIVDEDSKLQQMSVKRLFSSGENVLVSLMKKDHHKTFKICFRPLPSFHIGQKVHVLSKK